MVATASATVSVIVAAFFALWRFSHLIDTPVTTCNLHYPEEFLSVVCRCEHETHCEHECLCEHETHCDVRCEDSTSYPLQEDGERTFLIATSSISAGFAAGLLAGVCLCRGRVAAVPAAEEVVPDFPRLLIDGGRPERPALAALPF